MTMNHPHRAHFTRTLRAAMSLLDRVVEGQDVPASEVQQALEVTGDAPTLRVFRANAWSGSKAIARSRRRSYPWA